MDEAGLWATIMSSMGTQNSVKSAVSELKNMLSESPGPDRVCLKLAQILRVRRNEVAAAPVRQG
jgi:hypothetical protein